MKQITHHIITEDSSLLSWLSTIELEITQFEQLVEIGAVYLNKERLKSVPTSVAQDEYYRIHRKPRRFNCQGWKLIHEDSDVLIIDKPSGAPSHPTLDNKKENIKSVLEKHFQQELYLPHRLDTVTSGLLLLAKSKESLSAWSKRFESREIEKVYTAFTEKQVPPATYTHYMKSSPRAPKEILGQQEVDSQTCILEVKESKCLSSGLYENTVHLITGRTHQIRAQLAFIGSPILGDGLYGSNWLTNGSPHPAKGIQSDFAIGLVCRELRFADMRVYLEDIRDRIPHRNTEID